MKRVLFAIVLVLSFSSFVQEKKTIMFFGDSLTAGYGLNPRQAFPNIIQKKLESSDYNYHVINAGLSGETTAGGLARINWVLRQPVDIFVLELGANDGLRGLELSQTRENLQKIIDQVKAKNPGVKIVIAGMKVPPNMGEQYGKAFGQIFPALAEANDALLVPFLLEGVAGDSELNLADGIHPTADGHEIVAENIWRVIQPVL